MSTLTKALTAAAGNAGGDAQNVEDVFSTYIYDGAGSAQTIDNGINLIGEPTALGQAVADTFSTTLYNGTGAIQTITNGIDLDGEGGLVWIKNRGANGEPHLLTNSEDGTNKTLQSNSTGAASNFISGFSFNSNGFSATLDSGADYASWTFRKAPRFFDVVTYTGDGTTDFSKTLTHNLNTDVGMIIIKGLGNTYDWRVWHRNDGSSPQILFLNQSYNAQNDGTIGNVTSTDIAVAHNAANQSGVEYVAYLFAHDPNGANNDGMIACGSYTGAYPSNVTVNLGWEPQYLLVKNISSSSNWCIVDSARGFKTGDDNTLAADSSAAEGGVLGNTAVADPTATGFTVNSGLTAANASGDTHIYMAIRKVEREDGGGMVWIKHRSDSYDHVVQDTVRGYTKHLKTNNNDAESTDPTLISSFKSTGFSVGTDNKVNQGDKPYASWTFRKAPRFFDVVTYTGTGAGTAGRTISHNLGVAPGMIIVKALGNISGSWAVYHRSNGATKWQFLNYNWGTNTSNTMWYDTEPTSTEFTIGSDLSVNGDTTQFVAYLFAHDPDGANDDGMIACGSFTGTYPTNLEVNLGWEPQYVLLKNATDTSGDTIKCAWNIMDSMRGFDATGVGQYLSANDSDVEGGLGTISSTSTGFRVESPNTNDVGDTYIYMAIRSPMMVEPEAGTEVFAIDTRGNSGSTEPAFRATFPVDMAIQRLVNTTANNNISSRMTGLLRLDTNLTASEASHAYNYWDYMNGWYSYTGVESTRYSWMFKRAKGFMDVVAYTGDGVAGRTVNHSLGVVPEMIWFKKRSATRNWAIAHADAVRSNGDTGYDVSLNFSVGAGLGGVLNSTAPTDSLITISSSSDVNTSSDTYIAYLFATLAGISKVGSYTGNGSNQNIACGFSAGARFVLIKRTDLETTNSDWYTWDSTRGIITGNDPHLSLNTSVAEVTTDDSIDPQSAGFTVNQLSATNINVSSATYIFLAIA